MKLFLLVVSILLVQLTYSQNTFILKIKTKQTDIAWDIMQLENKSFVLIGDKEEIPYVTSTGIVYLINNEGDISDSLELIKQDTSVFLHAVDTMHKNISIIGTLRYGNEPNFTMGTIILTLDQNLQFVSEQIIPLPKDYDFIFSQYVKRNSNTIFIAGDANHKEFQEYSHDLFIYQINTTNNEINSTFLLKENIQLAQGFLVLPNKQGYCIFSMGGWGSPPGYSSGYYTVFDNNLNYIETDSLPGDLHSENYAVNLNQEEYLIAGREWVAVNLYGDNELRSVLYKMEYPNIPIKSFEYHMGIDTLSFPAYKSFDTSNTSMIYFSGTANVIPQEFPYQDDPSWIFLSKLDNELNHVWTQFYGGDMFYQVYSIKSTLDGGAIMACRTYDYLTQGLEHDRWHRGRVRRPHRSGCHCISQPWQRISKCSVGAADQRCFV